MEERRLSYCLAISEVLHIRPWEQRELLTVPELEAAIAYIDRRRTQH